MAVTTHSSTATPEPGGSDPSGGGVTPTTPLDQHHLGAIGASGLVDVPVYDRSALTVGVVHVGVGAFHRSHQAMYLDRLMSRGLALDWAVCGLGVLPADARMRDALQASDGLYTLVEKHPDGTRDVRVVGSLVEFVHAPDDPGAAVERLADPLVRIVSLTITEGGYNFSPVTGGFDLDRPDVVHDLAHPDAPRTVFGLVCSALRLRRARGVAPFTVMSCDNIQGNGHVAREVFTAFARALDPALAAWMETEVPFPNSMVDRITPVTTDADRHDVAARYGVADPVPVVCEDFVQWVLEDSFAQGRPPYEQAGVQVVDDVMPYELMKLRLLNASHQGLCYFARLAGYDLVHDAARDPLVAQFLLRYMAEEATPTLRPLPGVDLPAYRERLVHRFANEHVRDTVARLCAESSDRIPTWLLPVVRENLASGGPVRLSAAIVASWARYAEGVDEQGVPLEIVDRAAAQVRAAAARHDHDIDAFLRQEDLFGDLVTQERFVAAYREALVHLRAHGARKTLEHLLAG